ncbi:MAG: hypothetical protein CMF55_02000 [Legionellales bacterium]|nr:hypothetical protein [Legionellales bacterium]HAG62304.1 hypothetical protein [Coxiellaceae bacterium]
MQSLSHHLHRFLQILATTAFILFTLIILRHFSTDPLLWVVGATSLASSATILFFTPDSESANNRQLLLSYAIALGITLALRECLPFVTEHSVLLQHTHPFTITMVMIFIAMFITLYLFSLLHITHPPATGIALAMALHDSSYLIFGLLLCLALSLAVIKTVLSRCLENIL